MTKPNIRHLNFWEKHERRIIQILAIADTNNQRKNTVDAKEGHCWRYASWTLLLSLSIASFPMEADVRHVCRHYDCDGQRATWGLADISLHMMKYGEGGLAGWGSLYGTVNGGAAIIGLFEQDKKTTRKSHRPVVLLV